MKSIFILTLMLFVSANLIGQRAPGKIRKAFEQQYPEYRDVSWTYEGERIKEWTARFHVGNDSIAATYDSKANWLISLTFIEIEDLPQAVVDAIHDEYQGSTIKLAARYEEPGFDGFGAAFLYKKDRWGVQVSKEGKIVRRRLTSEGF
jgi:hypothetical protein